MLPWRLKSIWLYYSIQQQQRYNSSLLLQFTVNFLDLEVVFVLFCHVPVFTRSNTHCSELHENIHLILFLAVTSADQHTAAPSCWSIKWWWSRWELPHWHHLPSSSSSPSSSALTSLLDCVQSPGFTDGCCFRTERERKGKSLHLLSLTWTRWSSLWSSLQFNSKSAFFSISTILLTSDDFWMRIKDKVEPGSGEDGLRLEEMFINLSFFAAIQWIWDRIHFEAVMWWIRLHFNKVTSKQETPDVCEGHVLQ